MLGIINWQKKTHQMKCGRFSDLTDEQNARSGSIGVVLNMYTGWRNNFVRKENKYVILISVIWIFKWNLKITWCSGFGNLRSRVIYYLLSYSIQKIFEIKSRRVELVTLYINMAFLLTIQFPRFLPSFVIYVSSF